MQANKSDATIFLIPNTLGECDPFGVLPSDIKDIIGNLKFFVVENTRNARRFMKKVDRTIDIDSISFFELNKHTQPSEISDFLKPAIEGCDMGVISDAGCPGVADPGADVVRIAHRLGIKVKPLVGPSSILLSMMASGLNGQNFAFVGYLPIKQPERGKKIKMLESRIFTEDQTQIFIETPYRNNLMLSDLCKSLNDNIQLCIAYDVSLESESIKTQSIAQWKKGGIPDFDKKPAIFLIGK